MAKAHTGHLTGSDAVTSSVFRQFGITRVDGLDELLEVSAAFARTKPPSGNGVCVYSISGGTGAHMADMAASAGLRIPLRLGQLGRGRPQPAELSRPPLRSARAVLAPARPAS